jgi:hypothetical protein
MGRVTSQSTLERKARDLAQPDLAVDEVVLVEAERTYWRIAGST